ncbi:MAG TPA: HesA/MoeB/ThiF family protein [Methylomirabilota bacterium]|nr:HesA/MoeB/ThiF family protein [Methylomirabilota bacterium]
MRGLTLSDEQLRRYSRQMLLPEVGGAGQAGLRAARILVVGAGGLGSPAALYLAGAGVGTLGLADSEAVELSNLHRQILHGVKDLDRPKAHSGQARLEALNPEVDVVPHHLRLGPENVRGIVAEYDVVVEGSDNLPTKLLVNDACVALGRPLVIAGVVGWDGQLLVVRPGETACYRCVVRRVPPPGTLAACASAGILGPVAGVVGSLEAVEALKLCLGLASPAAGRLLLYDGRAAELTAVRVRRDPACPTCAERDR